MLIFYIKMIYIVFDANLERFRCLWLHAWLPTKNRGVRISHDAPELLHNNRYFGYK